MYIMYVDESGDTGHINSPSKYFILSAIVVHETDWFALLNDMIEFRRYLKMKYGLNMKEEIHASVFVNGRPKLNKTIPKNLRLDLLKKCLEWINTRNDISIVTIRLTKSKWFDIFDFGWRTLIQRFENTLSYKNFPNPTGFDKGLIVADDTDGGKLTKLLREMRRHNHVPGVAGTSSRNLKLQAVIEDPVFRNSANSYLHQMADVVAYFARQQYEPNKFIRKKGARTFYNKLNRVTNPFVSSKASLNNIVEL